MNPNYQRQAERIRELIEEGHVVSNSETSDSYGNLYIQGGNKVRAQAWLTKVNNIIELVFGQNSVQWRMLEKLQPVNIEYGHHAFPIIGVLEGALSDLEQGFLISQEFLVAGVIFDSVLEQAKHLNQNGFKDVAAVLGRVVLEDALRRIAREVGGIDDTAKASVINDDLRKINRYPQPQWRIIQGWLDIGNAAAHGQFANYTQEQVVNMLNSIEQFLAVELRI